MFRVFPAPAGINRADEQGRARSDRVPRASGDKPGLQPGFDYRDVCSPRQRG